MLVKSGLVSQEKQGRTKYCKFNYQHLSKVSELLEKYRAFWEKRLNALEKFIEKRKKKEDADSISTLSRSQASKNNKNKKVRYSKEATSAGKARMCELCKLVGALSFVYNTYWTKDCRKKDEYEKSLRGGAGSKKKAVKEYHASEKQLMHELKMLTRINKLKKAYRSQKKSKRTDNSDNDMSSVSSTEEDTNVSY